MSARAKKTNSTKHTRATHSETKMVVASFDINGTTIEANATNITKI
ncbi:hypothetical protein VCR5J5_190098 [Vibrio crassostreae]|uniref:Uncharacterized protein n=1 Tax=Vibrio crassostreae TaxID=246167 RepID=A0A822MXN7_9VIBR|nr:hypothetical protein VCR5J5_190098 [Vibrio crassostreae]